MTIVVRRYQAVSCPPVIQMGVIFLRIQTRQLFVSIAYTKKCSVVVDLLRSVLWVSNSVLMNLRLEIHLLHSTINCGFNVPLVKDEQNW